MFFRQPLRFAFTNRALRGRDGVHHRVCHQRVRTWTIGHNTCGSAAITAAPAAFDRERLVGRWGVASFHADKDQKRTEAEAKAQCRQPYTIKLGPTNGVLMHVADDPNVHELRLKGDNAGKTYLGFEAPPRDPQDREILSISDRMMTMRFVDPDANGRYGTFIYVRCG